MDIRNYVQRSLTPEEREQREREEAARVQARAQSLDLPWPRSFKRSVGKPSKASKYQQALYALVMGNDSLEGISFSCPSWWEAGMPLRTWAAKRPLSKKLKEIGLGVVYRMTASA
eukprot:5410591-Amphidinium_carterae.1